MDKLLFGNPEFKEGRNVTVRLGEKWAKVFEVDKKVIICDEEGYEFGLAALTDLKVCRFNELEESDLKDEHDTNCRTIKGLYKELLKVYGDKFQEESIVTVLGFRFDDEVAIV